MDIRGVAYLDPRQFLYCKCQKLGCYHSIGRCFEKQVTIDLTYPRQKFLDDQEGRRKYFVKILRKRILKFQQLLNHHPIQWKTGLILFFQIKNWYAGVLSGILSNCLWCWYWRKHQSRKKRYRKCKIDVHDVVE